MHEDSFTAGNIVVALGLGIVIGLTVAGLAFNLSVPSPGDVKKVHTYCLALETPADCQDIKNLYNSLVMLE